MKKDKFPSSVESAKAARAWRVAKCVHSSRHVEIPSVCPAGIGHVIPTVIGEVLPLLALCSLAPDLEHFSAQGIRSRVAAYAHLGIWWVAVL